MTYQKERFNPIAAPSGAVGVLAWATRLFQSVARAMPWAPAADTRDFVTVAEGADATPQFTNAVNAVGLGTLFVAPRVYRFSSDVTIPAATFLKLANGALLQPASGKTVTISGPIEAGLYQWMDFSAGGTFSFANNPNIDKFYPQWAAVGTGGDDVVRLSHFLPTVPDGGVIVATKKLKMQFASTWVWSLRFDVAFVGDGRPMAAVSGQAPEVDWIGNAPIIREDGAMTSGGTTLTSAGASFTSAYIGEYVVIEGANAGTTPLRAKVVARISATQLQLDTAASVTVSGKHFEVGGIAIYLDRCQHCRVYGLLGNFGTVGKAHVFIDGDGYSPGSIGTENEIAYNRMVPPAAVDASRLVRIGKSVPNNHEYYDVHHNVMDMQYSMTVANVIRNRYFRPDVSARSIATTAGSNAIVGTNTDFAAADVGQQIQIAQVTVAGPSATAPLVGIIKTVTDATHATIVQLDGVTALNATVTASGLYAVLGRGYGALVEIGPSPNAKGQRIWRNGMYSCRYGIDARGGSFESRQNNWNDCDINIALAVNGSAISEDCSDWKPNSEGSRQHFVSISALPFEVHKGRLSVDKVIPGDAYMKLGPTAGATKIDGLAFDVWSLPAGTTLYDVSTCGSAALEHRNNRYGNWSQTELGIVAPSANSLVEGGHNGTNNGNLDIDFWAIDQRGTARKNRFAGRSFFGIFETAPTDADILRYAAVAGEATIYGDPSNKQIIWRWRDASNTLRTLPLPQMAVASGAITVPGACAAGATITLGTVTVPNSIGFGDDVFAVGYTQDKQKQILFAQWTATDTYTVYQFNPTAGAVTLANGTAKLFLVRG